MQKDRDGSFAELGKALYEAGANAGALVDPAARVASIDRVRADAQSALEQLARVAGWAFALWGTGLYLYSGLLYIRQTRDVLSQLSTPAAA